MTWRVRPLVVSAALSLVIVVPGVATSAPAVIRVSVSTAGVEGTCGSWSAAVSNRAGVVAFVSCASELVADDTNGADDVFVRDLVSGETVRVSVASDGTEADGDSGYPLISISDDGRLVAFASEATNLVADDTNGYTDVFVHDRVTAETTRVSVGGTDRQANRYSDWPSISGNGRFVAFESAASNLVRGDSNGAGDVFVRDLVAGRTERVSVRSNGRQASGESGRPDISAGGRSVVFVSISHELVPGDTNGAWDVFVHDRPSGETTRVSVSSMDRQANDHSDWPVISGNGRVVAFVSWATNLAPERSPGLADVFAHDRRTGRTATVSARSDGRAGNDQSSDPAVSGGGRWVAFDSASSDLVGEDTGGHNQVYVHDLRTGRTVLASVARRGGPAAGDSSGAAFAPGGAWIAFSSDAPDVVRHDTNGSQDVFLRQR